MRLIIKEDPAAASKYVADYIINRINHFHPTPQNPFVLGLPTGSSPVLIYQNLVQAYNEGRISFQNVVTFNMDEYVGIPLSHPQSYHTFMYTHLFSHIDILPSNTHILNGTAPNLEKECVEFEQKIASAGGIDLFLAGLGADGHIAFNEPGSSLASRTRVKTLAYDTILANSRFFSSDIAQVPKLALTVGVQTVLEAREVVVIVTGQPKALATKMCVEGGVNHMWTGSALQLHPHPMLVLDEDATGELLVRTVKYFKSIEEVAKSQGFEQILPSAARTGTKVSSQEQEQTLHRGNGMRQNDLAAHEEEADLLAKEIERLKLQNIKPLTSTYLAAPATEYPVRSQSPDRESKTRAMERSVTPELRSESMGSRISDTEEKGVGRTTESGIAGTVTPELRNESMHSRLFEPEGIVGRTTESGLAGTVTPELRNESMHSRVDDIATNFNLLAAPASDQPSRSGTPELVNDSMHSRVGEEEVTSGGGKKAPTSLAAPKAGYQLRGVTPELVNDSMHSRVVGAV